MAQQNNRQDNENVQAQDSVRADKWLWAARFFKTRSLAKDAIEGGKVHYQGERIKVSKELRVGMVLSIRRGFEEKTVTILALSGVRGGAAQAQLLYQENEDSVARREFYAAQRKLSNLARPDNRPSKRDRRQIERFHQVNQGGYSPDDEGY